MTNVQKICTRVTQALVATFLVSAVTFGFEREARAQEILLTGPLAGAPSVRKQRLYRKGRVELAPQVSFTLLDEYQRLILVGARLNYNITDWLAIGAWGALSPAPLKQTTALSDEIQRTNEIRQNQTAMQGGPSLNHRLTQVNVGQDFEKQLGTIEWAAAPQITLIPFRGKIGVFQSIYVDTDLYVFGGPAFVGVKERADCERGGECIPPGGPGSADFDMASRSTIAPTFGLGFQFYFNRFLALGAEFRMLPFARNTGGFDNRGGPPNEDFPDFQIDEKDREFKLNQMISVSFGVSLPFQYKVSE
jgi:hypothetical protein